MKNIKYICIDCDGTLTDGKYTVDEYGKISKQFYTRDFYMIEEALKNGYIVIIATSSIDDVIQEKVKDFKSHINIDKKSLENLMIIQGDKCARMFNYFSAYNVPFENIAYIGDAENDIDIMNKNDIGLRGCPFDAIEEVKKYSDVISSFKGGEGAVWEFIKFIMKRG